MKTTKTSLLLAAAIAVMSLPVARADQPHMKDALGHLQEARAALAVAIHNKAGHREKALQLVDRAIAEVQAGIAAGR